ncbi:MAG: hypothetical protein P9L88_04380 [Candidatus Tantalella remota]|nr:hypothetical protein [Candidatus Tantalella remota]
MGIAGEIKTLGEDIIASYDMRVKAIGELVTDTHKMLKDFGAEHKEMSVKLKAGLAEGEEIRLKDFKAMMVDIQKFVSGITREATDMIKRFQKEHKAMADVLAGDLAKGEEDRLKVFKSMMSSIQKEVRQIETYVKKKLKEFDDAHDEMSVELKKMLANYVDDMVKATKKLMSDIQARQKERNTEVADLLKGYQDEREKMAANWEALTVAIARKRGGKPVVSTGTEVTTAAKAVKKTPAAKKTAVKKTATVAKKATAGKSGKKSKKKKK